MGIILILVGLAAATIGYQQFRGPWARYQELKAQDANIARYESWRGGLRDTGPTGASVAMDMLRKRVRNAGIMIGAGVAVAFIGLVLWR